MQTLKSKFLGLSFKWKLLLVFVASTLLSFMVFDLTFHLILQNIITNVDLSSSTDQFNHFSNHQIIYQISADVLSGLDIFDEYITQVFVTMHYFQNNPGIYKTLQEKGVNPPLTSTFNTPQFDRASVYFYTQNSTFYDEPYVDSVLSNIGSSSYPYYLQRFNIIYQAVNNTDDIMIRTIPGTSNFTVYSAQDVNWRIEQATQGNVSISNWYYDQFSLADNSTQLIGLRMLIRRQWVNVLIQIQMKRQLIQTTLQQIYSYPNTNIFIIKIIDISTNQFQVLGQHNPSGFNNSLLMQFLQIGEQEAQINEQNYLVTTIGILDEEPVGTPFVLGINNNAGSQLRTVLFLNEADTSQALDIVEAFLEKEESTLIILIYSWTIMMTLGAVGLALVVGNHQTRFIQFVTKKCYQYTRSPQTMHSIYLKVKESASKQEKNRLLLENLASIMQKVELKKKKYQNNVVNEYEKYPKNLLSYEFQSRMNMNDLKRFEDVGRQLQNKVNKKQQQK